MGLNPGDIRIIDPDDIAEMFMMTTHNMPLNYHEGRKPSNT